uniref:Uncharacterized protein n=1 Tax=uncultured marine virus TaxID=186617 RepID=A0A0F7L5X0_9VIRU|nr:hypothetical protein [uncultured marine virus]
MLAAGRLQWTRGALSKGLSTLLLPGQDFPKSISSTATATTRTPGSQSQSLVKRARERPAESYSVKHTRRRRGGSGPRSPLTTATSLGLF